jgi:hypothetical protein
MAGPRQRRRTASYPRSNTGGARHGGESSRNKSAVFSATGSTTPTDALLLSGASGWLLLAGDQQTDGTDYLIIV